MLNNHVSYEFIHKKAKICIIWCNLHVILHYVYTNETNIFKFWPNVSKKFNKCLISNQIPKYLATHMENIFQVQNPK